MERPIAYNLLHKDELIYEVEIRDVKPETTVSALRLQIQNLAIRVPADEVGESSLDVDVDLTCVERSLEELRSFFNKQKMSFKKFNRIRALAHHLFHRLGRMNPVTELAVLKYTRLEEELNTLLVKVDNLFTSYHISFEQAKKPVDLETSIASRPLEKQLKSVSLLNHKYSGTSCVRTYLQRLDELCVTRRISEAALLQGAVELFTEHALVWYRGVRDTFEDWSQLKIALLNEFLPVDFDKRLLVEIRNRTQGPTESTQHFISIMLNYFMRLTVPLSESEQLGIIQFNLRPSIVRELSLVDISSLEVLKAKCRLLEHGIARAADFREPPKINEHTLAPDLAYQSKACPKVNVVESRPTFCVRCRRDGHVLKDCSSREVVCFTCGNKGYTSASCPKCKKGDSPVSKNE